MDGFREHTYSLSTKYYYYLCINDLYHEDIWSEIPVLYMYIRTIFDKPFLLLIDVLFVVILRLVLRLLLIIDSRSRFIF